MAKELTRDEAETFYADEIVNRGNPHYFVYKVIAGWEDHELEEAIADFYKQIESNDEPPVILEEE